MSEETKDEDSYYSFSRPLPGAIHKFENLLLGRFTVRDAIAGAMAITIPVFIGRILPIPLGWQLLVTAAMAIPALMVALHHLVTDEEPIERRFFSEVKYKYIDINELSWAKEYVGTDDYAKDTTQSLWPMFDIDENGFLLFRERNSGGSALLTIEASDYSTKKGSEQYELVDQYIGLLESLAGQSEIPIQVLVKSMPIDLSEQVAEASARMAAVPSGTPLANAHAAYMEYLMAKQADTSLYEKRFYIVISYVPENDDIGRLSLGGGVGIQKEQIRKNNPLANWARARRKNQSDLDLELNAKDYSKGVTVEVLRDRVREVRAGLDNMSGTSVRAARPEEYVELMYYFFNPGDSQIKHVLENGLSQGLAVTSSQVMAMRSKPAASTAAAGNDFSSLLDGLTGKQ